MLIHHDPTQTRQQKIVQPTVVVPDSVARSIEAAVRPYALTFQSTHEGALLRGDSTAVALAALIVERLGELTRAPLDLSSAERCIADTIDYQLRHELAFRLVGLAQAVRPMSLSQVAYMNALLRAPEPLIFGVGPTGTGKTHLALAAGLNALASGRVKKLIATRPHDWLEGQTITAAARAETIRDEQLAPLEDELHSLISAEEVRRLTESDQLDLLPLGLMRGRTFNEAFIVVDEAQNITVPKMRMLVTRLGRASRMVLAGDPSQAHLHEEESSGLAHLMNLVRDAEFALVHEFDASNIIRNPVVARLEALYAQDGGTGLRR